MCKGQIFNVYGRDSSRTTFFHNYKQIRYRLRAARNFSVFCLWSCSAQMKSFIQFFWRLHEINTSCYIIPSYPRGDWLHQHWMKMTDFWTHVHTHISLALLHNKRIFKKSLFICEKDHFTIFHNSNRLYYCCNISWTLELVSRMETSISIISSFSTKHDVFIISYLYLNFMYFNILGWKEFANFCHK